MRIPALVALVLLLAGCQSPSLQEFASRCEAYGFKTGTEEMATCIQRESLAWEYGYAPGWGGPYR